MCIRDRIIAEHHAVLWPFIIWWLLFYYILLYYLYTCIDIMLQVQTDYKITLWSKLLKHTAWSHISCLLRLSRNWLRYQPWHVGSRETVCIVQNRLLSSRCHGHVNFLNSCSLWHSFETFVYHHFGSFPFSYLLFFFPDMFMEFKLDILALTIMWCSTVFTYVTSSCSLSISGMNVVTLFAIL